MATVITGDQGSFTFSGGDTLVPANFGRWTMIINRSVSTYAVFGGTLALSGVGQGVIRGVLNQFHDDDSATPPIPSGTSGTLTLLAKTGQSWQFAARLYTMTSAADATGPIQEVTYEFISNGGTVTKTG